ncbi:MAG: polysaccharide biosynthesis tyrosine autokinase [Verrucomicrobiales bacterium]|nr:polysaccharide biosynthesis tyrosine autokinase [Verrucomicrobiales bacterium]
MNSHSSLSGSSSPFPGYPTLDLEAMAKGLLRKSWLIGAVVGACVVVTAIYVTFIAKKRYQSTAVIYIEQEQVLNEAIRGVRSDDYSKLDSLKSLEQSITSGSVILRVVEKHGLLKQPDFLKPKSGGRPYTEAEVVEAVAKRVKATLRRGTRLIDVEVTDTSPARAQQLAQAFVDEFEAHMMEQNLQSSRKATAMLQEQAEEQLARVNVAEEALQKFREDHADVPMDEGGIIEKKLADLDRLLSEAKNDRLKLEAQVQKLDAAGTEDPERILEIANPGDQESIEKLLFTRNTKRAEMVKIQSQYQPTHPVYVSFIAELEGLEKEVAETARRMGESVRKRLETAREHETTLAETVNEQKREVLSADRTRKEFRSLKQAVDAAYQTYYALQARINETNVTEGVKESLVRMQQEPLMPVKPSSPKKTLAVGLAGVLGMFLGVGLVVALHLLDRSLRTRRQIEQTLGLPVLSEIADAPEAGDTLRDSLVVFSEPHSLAAESFRSLRMSLSTLSPRSVLVTSAISGEGKSFCAANLALLQAQMGYRTLLVDADFRRPSLSGALMHWQSQMDPNTTALETKNVCQKTPFPNLYLISCAQFAPNSSEVMSGEHFATMLWEAYRSFDCVIIDTSPLALVSDALNFARYADAVVLVARAGRTQAGDAQKACRELRQLRVPLAGCILNGVVDSERSKAYFETYRPATAARPTLALGMSPRS